MPDGIDEKFEDALKLQLMSLVWSWLKPALLPVVSAVLVTQLGASVFMQGHVDTALKTEVAPTAKHMEALHKGVKEAYSELAKVTNAHAKMIHGKASVSKVQRLEAVILQQRKELEEAFVMLEAMGAVVQSKHGRGTFQRAMDAVTPVEVAAKETREVIQPPAMPLVPLEFTAFYGAEGKKDEVRDPYDR